MCDLRRHRAAWVERYELTLVEDQRVLGIPLHVHSDHVPDENFVIASIDRAESPALQACGILAEQWRTGSAALEFETGETRACRRSEALRE